MTLGIFIGRFQPFHKQHLESILELYKITDRILIFLTYYTIQNTEVLTSKSPIPLKYRMSYINSILKDYLDENRYVLLPLNVSNMNFIFKILDTIRTYNDKKIIFSTRDIKRLAEYKIFSIILKLLSYDVKIIYENDKKIQSYKIREAIREDKYLDIREYLVKDLDKKIITYIKYFNNKKGENRNHILEYII